jgi:transposase-like protein
MPRTRPPYPPEFRLGDRISPIGGERYDVLRLEGRQQLRELERENKVLRQEREILKRSAR